MSDLPRRTINMIGSHAANIGAVSMERIEADERYWSAAYRIDLPESGVTWAEVSTVLETMADDEQLLAQVGRKRGIMVMAEYAFAGRRGRAAQTEFASLTTAEDIETALRQASATADDGPTKYHRTKVFSLILYFR